MSLVSRLINWFQVWYGWKDLPELENIPPSGHGEWIRHPEPQTEQLLVVQPPAVQVQPVHIVSARERARFHKMRLELFPPDDSWLNAGPTTGPINVSDIKTQPVERDTETTLEVPALSRLIHSRGREQQ